MNPKRSGKKLLRWIRLLISSLILLFLIRRYYPEIGTFSYVQVNYRYLFFVFLNSIVLIPLLAARRWQIILQSSERKTALSNLLTINYKSIFWGMFLPSGDGFAPIRIYYLEKDMTDRPGLAGSSVILEKVMGIIILSIVSISGILISDKSRKDLVLIPLLLLLVCTVLILLPAYLQKSTSKKNITQPRKLCRIFSYLKSLAEETGKIASFRIIFRTAPLILTIQLLGILNIDFLFRFWGEQLSFLDHLAILPLIQIISLLPVTLGGLGLRETAFASLYESAGLNPVIAVTVSLLNFLILTGNQALIGGIISISSQLKTPEKAV